MWILVVSLVLLGVFAFWISKYQGENDIQTEEKTPENANPSCKDSEYCCGAHEICEEGKKKKKQAVFDYYEDEELDRFQNRQPNSYSPEEIEEFKEVLETLQINEINGWLKSLNNRGIFFPKPLIGLLTSRCLQG